MVNSVCGASVVFHAGLFPSQLGNRQKIKEDAAEREWETERLQSRRRISLNKGSPKTTSNMRGVEWGEGGSWIGFMCERARMNIGACKQLCVHRNMTLSCMDASRLCCSHSSVEKKKRLSALIKSLERVCV